MIKISEYIKKLYIEDGTPIELEVRFKDSEFPTIKGSDVLSEQMTLHESICEEEQLKFGGCNASSFELTVYGLDSNIKDYEIDPVIITNGAEIPLGTFYVDTIEKFAGKDYKKLTAYDKMRYFDVDVKEWYENLTFPMSVKDFRDSLCNYIGVEQNEATLIVDSIMLKEKLDSTSGINGLSLMRSICEISGVFGRMDRYGKFDYLSLESSMLLPSDDIYPSNGLYPSAGGGNSENSLNIPSSITYENPLVEDFFTAYIDEVIIVDSEGAQVITEYNDNPYYINDNFVIIGQTHKTIKAIADALLAKIGSISYRPVNSSKIKGQPYAECGDFISGEISGYGYEAYIFNRDMTGIKALRDAYTCNGKQYLENDMNGVTATLQRLSKATEKVKTSVEITEKGLESEVRRAAEAESELSTKITQTESSISSEVNRATETEGELSSKIEQTERQIVLRVDSETGKIVQVSLMGDTGSGTEFKVKADNINLTANDVINLISGGTINLTSSRISFASTNFNVDENGNAEINKLKANEGEFSGKINANSGKIGGDLYIDGGLRFKIENTERYFDFLKSAFLNQNLGTVSICSPISGEAVISITERLNYDLVVYVLSELHTKGISATGINADHAQISDCNLYEKTVLHGDIQDNLGHTHAGLIGTYTNKSFDSVASFVKFSDSNNLAVTSNGVSYIVPITEFSDKRLKKNIFPSKVNATEELKKIELKQFDYVDSKYGKHKDVGYIADELGKVFPECVHEAPQIGSEKTYKQVDDRPIIPYLVKAVQELSERVKRLENKLGGANNGSKLEEDI